MEAVKTFLAPLKIFDVARMTTKILKACEGDKYLVVQALTLYAMYLMGSAVMTWIAVKNLPNDPKVKILGMAAIVAANAVAAKIFEATLDNALQNSCINQGYGVRWP